MTKWYWRKVAQRKGGGQKKKEDCYYYYYSTCTRGDLCPFRHEPNALGCEEVCPNWKNKRKCGRKNCSFRHMGLKKERKSEPCYHESTPAGCCKPHCPFLHKIPKPTVSALRAQNQTQTEIFKDEDRRPTEPRPPESNLKDRYFPKNSSDQINRPEFFSTGEEHLFDQLRPRDSEYKLNIKPSEKPCTITSEQLTSEELNDPWIDGSVIEDTVRFTTTSGPETAAGAAGDIPDNRVNKGPTMPALLPDSDSEDELPPNWEERATVDGSVYYVNHNTKSTQWTHPRTGKKKKVAGELPFGWEKVVEDSGKILYVDHENHRTTYTDPRLAFAQEEKDSPLGFRQRFDGSSTALQVLHGRDLNGKTAVVTGANSGIGVSNSTENTIHFHDEILKSPFSSACQGIKVEKDLEPTVKRPKADYLNLFDYKGVNSTSSTDLEKRNHVEEVNKRFHEELFEFPNIQSTSFSYLERKRYFENADVRSQEKNFQGDVKRGLSNEQQCSTSSKRGYEPAEQEHVSSYQNRIEGPFLKKPRKSDIRLAVVPSNYPTDTLCNMYKEVEEQIIRRTESKFRKKISNRFLRKGALIVVCDDSECKEWLQSFIPQIHLPGTRLKTLHEQDLNNYFVKIEALVYNRYLKPKLFLKLMVQKSQRELNAGAWELLYRESCKAGDLFGFLVDKHSLHVLEKRFRWKVPCKSSVAEFSTAGFETARALARHGCHVVLACRSVVRASKAIERIKAERPQALCTAVPLDFRSLKSVKEFVNILRGDSRFNRGIDVLILNAGVFALPYSLTEDGIETTFQVNYLSQFYLTMLLEEMLARAAPSRVVFVSSESHRYSTMSANNISEEWLNPDRMHYWSMMAYNDSKLCQVVAARELARRWVTRDICVFSCHPGNLVSSNLSRHWCPYRLLFTLVRPFTKSLEQAASTQVYCASALELSDVTGLYFNNCCRCEPSKPSLDTELAAKLWRISLSLIGSHFSTLGIPDKYRNKR